MTSSKEANRERLIRLLEKIPFNKEPEGWRHVATIAVGGLHSVGFSRQHPYLLVVSSSGRGLIDCRTGEKIERDYDAYAGLDELNVNCHGIGEIEDEVIQLGGICGGGLPLMNRSGESLELVSPNWPESRLVLAKPYKNALVPGHQADCSVIYTECVRVYGFSWCGHYIVAACGSDLDLWARKTRLTN
ncbi:hypothetical protein [Metapseudomonas otitidis]|uniref:hypothetical protein n=1 Tax=Metapseudomonas otitidis TaxID=319939 RepID=UPI0013DFA8E6|nr:hypothetical protein [Pseudomonas otitidis]MDH0336294.1 hypothetical protein [Pseudomonas otitidis]